MGMTMTQKILAAHAGLECVEAGQLIEADLDLVLGNDITSPVAIKEMEKMKVDGVFHKDKINFFLIRVKHDYTFILFLYILSKKVMPIRINTLLPP